MLVVIKPKMPQSKEEGLELLNWGIIGVDLSSKGSPSKVLHNFIRSAKVNEIVLITKCLNIFLTNFTH